MALEVHIIRGLPGAGKSTLAKKIPCATVMEADMFFFVNGVYKYQSNMISMAHNWCFTNTVRLLRKGTNVAVANTFTTVKEVERYLNLKTYFPELKIVVTELYTNYGSIHEVPNETIKAMEKRWEQLPEYVFDDFDIILNTVDTP